jgi:phosphohistidine swiveling domain-containing protein
MAPTESGAVAETLPPRAIVIGSRRGERRLDASASRPYALLDVHERPVLDWIETALRSRGLTDLTYVGGYQIQKVMERYGQLSFRYHGAWQEEGELAALRLAVREGAADHVIVRSDTILLGDAVRRLFDAPASVAFGVYGEQSPNHASFGGVMLIRAAATPVIMADVDRLLAADPKASLDSLVALLPDALPVDVSGLAAPVADATAVLQTVFRGKAGTLEGLARLCRSAIVLDQVKFSVPEWAAGRAAVLTRIRKAFVAGRVVVRSSTSAEDALEASAAGRFESVLDVAVDDDTALGTAVDHVIASYAGAGRLAQPDDDVLIQPFVPDLAASGVLFTRELTTHAPYFVLTVDRRSGRSDVVTSGAGGEIETYFVSWAAAGAASPFGSRFPADASAVSTADVGADRLGDFEAGGRVLDLGRELINLTYSDSLDIEFGVDRGGSLYLFQVRPLTPAATREAVQISDDDLLALVADAQEFAAERMAPRPGLPGHASLLGNMPDWNPAEMIGASPRPLALSLYQRLIGDRAWSRARARIGYRDVEPEPLILSVGGRPYVDVRASLASFLPASLDDETGMRWVDACIERLRREPHLHDKIEFEVTPTCMSFDWERHAERMRNAGLDGAAIGRFAEGLRGLTGSMLAAGDAAVRSHLAEMDRLVAARRTAAERPARSAPAAARAVRDHIERCERFGVEPFAILARYAFVSLALLRSLRDRGALSDEEMSLILRSVPTVAAETAEALESCAAGRSTRQSFVDEYGHLRSNSYEITAPNYAASLDRMLPAAAVAAKPSAADDAPDPRRAAEIMTRHAQDIDRLLAEAGLPGDHASLLAFVRTSIAARERSKFEFMKDLNLALETIADFGARLKLTPDEMSYVPVSEILVYATDSLTSSTAARLRRTSGHNRKRADLTAALRLPDLIVSSADVAAFRQETWQPNFVTNRRIVAPPAVLDGNVEPGYLDGAIVCIRSADPGYDWIFSHRIAGLITQFGGIGSHMAIRAAEFGIPAAIGCGATLFDRARAADRVDLDCANRQIRAI